MITLSKKQKKIVEYDTNTCIQLLASAGTGKTRILTERVRYVLNQANKAGVIALTFTNKAAKEMKMRLEHSNSEVKNCWISTIHSIAQRIIDQYGYTIGLPADLNIYDREQDRRSIFSQSLYNTGVSCNTHQQRDYMYEFSKIKRELLTDNEIKKKYNDQTLSIFNSYQQELKKAGGIDFDDILVYAHRILIEQPWCAKIYSTKYKYIFIDEAQDLNKAQYELIKALSAGGIKSIMMVGDPNQMIYGFNGSSKDYLCKFFKKDFSDLKFSFKAFELKENYRSSKKVIHLANCLKPHSQEESQFAITGKCEFKDFEDESKEAQWIVQKIKSILQKQKHKDIEGDISLDNMVVIARNQFVFQSLKEELEKNEIKFTLKITQSVLNPISDLGIMLDLAIRLKVNPKDWISEKKLCELLKINSYNKKNDYILKAVASSITNSDPLMKLKKDILNRIINLDAEDPNMPKVFNEIEGDIQTIGKMINGNNSHETNMKIHELDIFMHDLEEFKKYWNLFRKQTSSSSLLAFKTAISLGELVGNNVSSIDTAKLTLSTVHTMKGLEKDIVFLMGMCEGVFPDYRATTEQAIAEEKNTAFVAITRARRWIYITWSKQHQTRLGNIRQVRSSQFVRLMREKTSLNLEGQKQNKRGVV